MGLAKRIAAVVVPVGLVVGGVAYGVSHQQGKADRTLGQCTTKVAGLTVILTDGQARNASLIAAISIQRGMPAHAATIALATALQESKLYNLAGGDLDSQGLFQQRPSQGWGTAAQVRDPVHATNAFYDALERVPGWETLAVTKAAQAVQRSGFPSAYAAYEGDARALASALTGYSPAAFRCHLAAPAGASVPVSQRAAAFRAALVPAFGSVGLAAGTGGGLDVSAGSAPRGWAIACFLVAHATQLRISSVTYRGRVWSAGSTHGWAPASAQSVPGDVIVGF